jgi:L-lactate dehydrogenase complex protein LldF
MKAHPQDYIKIMHEEIKKQDQTNFMNQVGAVFGYLTSNSLSQMSDPVKAREQSQAIRENSINNLPLLLEEFEKNAVKNGIEVLWAVDADEACAIIKDLVVKHEAKIITKGKSMITEEIDLNHYLEEQLGVKIYEGDLGELIVQMRGTPPFHIVGPAINLNIQQIAQTLVDHIGMEYTEEAVEIAGNVRNFMRRQFEHADMGITGVNMAVASTGSIVLVENEGNIRWSTAAPPVHVAIMSIEKVVANMADAFHVTEMLTRSCTGQGITSYVSVISGPRDAGELDGAEKMYVIIVDNGRSQIYKDPFLRQALNCIRCGRCGTACPIYLTVGAYPYGWCYPGPMGTVISPLLLGLDDTYHVYEACTLCGGCQSVCPSGIDHVDLYHHYRAMKAAGNKEFKATPVSTVERTGFKGWAAAVKNPQLFKRSVSLVRYYLKLGSKEGQAKKMSGPLKAWFAYRDLPIAEKTFHQYWAELNQENELSMGEAAAQTETDKGGQDHE